MRSVNQRVEIAHIDAGARKRRWRRGERRTGVATGGHRRGIDRDHSRTGCGQIIACLRGLRVVVLRRRCGVRHDRGGHSLRARRTRWIGVAVTEDLRGEVAHPTRLVPAGQPAGEFVIVEDDAITRVVEQTVDLVEVRVVLRIEVDHHDVRLRARQCLAIECMWRRLVHDWRTQRRHRFAQALAEFARLAQHRNGNARIRISHARAPVLPGHAATSLLPDRVFRDSVRPRFQARAGDASRRCAK